ncbi:MAG: hypothetical protein J7M19_05760 [Planctomycetes bacterium]|nr:hypothetical protein [Planctomycetota bacterium]
MSRILPAMLLALVCIAAPLAAAEAPDAKAAKAPDVKAINDSFDKSIVKVLYHLRYDQGVAPGQGYRPWRGGGNYSNENSAREALQDERPLTSSGFLLAGDLVVTDDPMLEDRFISRIEVEASGKRYAAVPEKFALSNRGLFLRLEAPVEGGVAVKFDAEAEGPYYVVRRHWTSDDWSMELKPLEETFAIDKSGQQYAMSASGGLVATGSGVAVGAVMSRVRRVETPWKGSPLEWPTMDAAEFTAKLENIRQAAASGLLAVTIKLRLHTSRRDESYYYRGGSQGEQRTEIEAVGVLLAPGKVLVLSDLSRRDTARIESMTVSCGEASADLSIDGALKRFSGILASFEGDLEGAKAVTPADIKLAEEVETLLVADRLSLDKFARDEHFLRARVPGDSVGFKGLGWPHPSSGAGNAFLFTLDGKLAAIPLALRKTLRMGGQRDYDYGYRDKQFLAMPMRRLEEMRSDMSEYVDADYKPLSEEESKRLAWLGIEAQGLDIDLARAQNVSLATRGGEVGGIISHVYKGSPAEAAGVETGDVLVRFEIPGQAKPVDFKPGETQSMQFPWAQLDQVPDIYFERLPRPWPSRDNTLTKFLTQVGIGKKVTAVFLRKGEERRIDFVLQLGPRDFASAAKFEDKETGLTVKNVTYEARHYFHMDDSDSGVAVAEIKPGSKASVAGLKPCEIITQVSGKPVANIEEFKKALADGGELPLTVQRMSQSRVVRLPLEPKAQKEEKAAPEETSSEKTAPEEADEEEPLPVPAE